MEFEAALEDYRRVRLRLEEDCRVLTEYRARCHKLRSRFTSVKEELEERRRVRRISAHIVGLRSSAKSFPQPAAAAAGNNAHEMDFCGETIRDIRSLLREEDTDRLETKPRTSMIQKVATDVLETLSDAAQAEPSGCMSPVMFVANLAKALSRPSSPSFRESPVEDAVPAPPPPPAAPVREPEPPRAVVVSPAPPPPAPAAVPAPQHNNAQEVPSTTVPPPDRPLVAEEPVGVTSTTTTTTAAVDPPPPQKESIVESTAPTIEPFSSVQSLALVAEPSIAPQAQPALEQTMVRLPVEPMSLEAAKRKATLYDVLLRLRREPSFFRAWKQRHVAIVDYKLFMFRENALETDECIEKLNLGAVSGDLATDMHGQKFVLILTSKVDGTKTIFALCSKEEQLKWVKAIKSAQKAALKAAKSKQALEEEQRQRTLNNMLKPAPTVPEPPTGSSRAEQLKFYIDALRQVYSYYEPNKMPSFNKVTAAFKGREKEVLYVLLKKHGGMPPTWEDRVKAMTRRHCPSREADLLDALAKSVPNGGQYDVIQPLVQEFGPEGPPASV